MNKEVLKVSLYFAELNDNEVDYLRNPDNGSISDEFGDAWESYDFKNLEEAQKKFDELKDEHQYIEYCNRNYRLYCVSLDKYILDEDDDVVDIENIDYYAQDEDDIKKYYQMKEIFDFLNEWKDRSLEEFDEDLIYDFQEKYDEVKSLFKKYAIDELRNRYPYFDKEFEKVSKLIEAFLEK